MILVLDQLALAQTNQLSNDQKKEQIAHILSSYCQSLNNTYQVWIFLMRGKGDDK